MKYINGLIKIQNYEKCIFFCFNEVQFHSNQLVYKFLYLNTNFVQLIIQHNFSFNSKYIADFKDKPDPES